MTLTMYAIYKMLFETCGEDPDVLEKCHIREINKNCFHITYKEDDPFDGIDFEVEIEIEEDVENPTSQHRYTAKYYVFDSVYGDDGDFEIKL